MFNNNFRRKYVVKKENGFYKGSTTYWNDGTVQRFNAKSGMLITGIGKPIIERVWHFNEKGVYELIWTITDDSGKRRPLTDEEYEKFITRDNTEPEL